MILNPPVQNKRSTLVEIINEVDDLTDKEKDFVLYWLRAKKYAQSASEADFTKLPNNLTNEDIYNELKASRKRVL